jgi:hypothetical protein
MTNYERRLSENRLPEDGGIIREKGDEKRGMPSEEDAKVPGEPIAYPMPPFSGDGLNTRLSCMLENPVNSPV